MSDQQLHDVHDLATDGAPEDTDWEPYSSTGSTAVLKSFPGPCNFAVASPDGQWVAVVGDSACVVLLHRSDEYRLLVKTLAEVSSARRKRQKSAVLQFRAKRPRMERRTFTNDFRDPAGEFFILNLTSAA